MRSLTEQAAAVAARTVSPVELVAASLAAIEREQPRLNAFTVVLDEQAIAQARVLADRAPLGPLHGVPIAVKDLYDVKGVATTGCCAAYAERVARADAAVVEALRAAGAIVLAKTNQHELACGATTQVSSFGPAFNPWDTSRVPGGSSGGSGGAVGAGVVAMAMGSDTGGSIRIPSSLCGVTGLKPTHGAISLRGAMPMCPSFDTAGPLAVSAQDCALVWRVLQGFDPDDALSLPGPPAPVPETIQRLRVAIPRSFLAPAEPHVADALASAARTLESLGLVVDEIEGPDLDEAGRAWTEIGFAEVADCYRDLWDDERVSEQIRWWFQTGRNQPGADHAQGIRRARRVRRDFEWSLTANDALLAPCTPVPAPPAGPPSDVGRDARLAQLTSSVNVAGLPSLAFPIGFSSEGLPLGAQLIGRPWSEEVLLAVIAAYQTATDWHTTLPPR